MRLFHDFASKPGRRPPRAAAFGAPIPTTQRRKPPMRTPCKTVADLIAALERFDPQAVVFSYEHPPFDSVTVVPQADGSVMISGPARDQQ